jgi:hypothetical protein
VPPPYDGRSLDVEPNALLLRGKRGSAATRRLQQERQRPRLEQQRRVVVAKDEGTYDKWCGTLEIEAAQRVGYLSVWSSGEMNCQVLRAASNSGVARWTSERRARPALGREGTRCRPEGCGFCLGNASRRLGPARQDAGVDSHVRHGVFLRPDPLTCAAVTRITTQLRAQYGLVSGHEQRGMGGRAALI